METVISVECLRKAYGSLVAVDEVGFEVNGGEIFGLLGPNGAGKTTTVECIQGLRHPTSGSIHILGLDPITRRREVRRRIGSQLQESALPERLKVWEALDLFASASGRGGDWRCLMNQWGLSEHARKSFGSLSGGQQQRLFVALALVNDPEIVFLDEVTTGLDPQARRTAWDLIEEIRDRGVTVVLVTHFMEEAERLCDRIAIVDRGRIVATGSPSQLVDNLDRAVTVLFTADGPDFGFLEDLPEVSRVQRSGERVTVEGHGAVLAHVAAALVARDIAPPDLRVERATLEDVFLEITGHAMRE
jgi:ABC-2 type transport system ATP-binding protein